MTKVKCQIVVTAGYIPNQSLPELTKHWEWQPEEILPGGLAMSPERLMEFHNNVEEAHRYAQNLSNPGYANWVRLEWIWL